jgi:hypothetical protein
MFVAAGEVLTCSLAVPVHDPGKKYPEHHLQCRARVIHVVPQRPDGPWGIGCSIDEYHFGDTTSDNMR